MIYEYFIFLCAVPRGLKGLLTCSEWEKPLYKPSGRKFTKNSFFFASALRGLKISPHLFGLGRADIHPPEKVPALVTTENGFLYPRFREISSKNFFPHSFRQKWPFAPRVQRNFLKNSLYFSIGREMMKTTTWNFNFSLTSLMAGFFLELAKKFRVFSNTLQFRFR